MSVRLRQPTKKEIIWIEQCIKSSTDRWCLEWCEEMIHNIHDENERKRLFSLVDKTSTLKKIN